MNNNTPVTAQEVAKACELLRANGINPLEATRGHIRGLMNIGDRRSRTIKEWISRGGIPEIAAPATTFDQAYAEYKNWIGMSGTHKTPAAPTLTQERLKIISASDFHVPFHHRGALKALLEEAPSTDLLVIPGDFLTSWSWSRWPKGKKETEPLEEFREGQAVLTLLAESFKRIVVFGGNHCHRTRKYLAERLPPEVMSYLAVTAPGALNPLSLMASELKNVEIAESISKDHATFDFLWQHGDCVFSHAEKYSVIPGKAATGPVLHWLKSFAEPMGIVKNVRTLVQAHTHQLSYAVADFGVLAIESGCLCEVESYIGDAKIMSPRPPTLGWVEIHQTNGRTDWRMSRPIPVMP
jgi:hypothetical protein